MIAPRQTRPTGRLLGPDGRPLASAMTSPSDGRWGVAPWESDRNAPMLRRSGPDDRLIRPSDRLRIVEYLRWSARTDPVLGALLYRYALGVGSPTVRSSTGDPAYDERRDLYLEARMRSAGVTGSDMAAVNRIISIEEAIGGEVFVVFARTGAIQIIPTELCGSPAVPPANERHGIQFAATGRPTAYRFGVRLASGGISFETADGAQIVSADYVHHLGEQTRVEEVRYAPRLAGVVQHLDRLRRILDSKTIAIQNQAAFSLFITKNQDPQAFSTLWETATSEQRTELLEQTTARSTAYTDLQAGMIYFGEVGESIQPISPQIDASDFGDFAFLLVELICAPLGIRPEEVLFGYRRSTYSSARADKLGWRQTVDSIRRRREQMLDAWQRWQIRRGALLGEIDLPPAGMLDEVRWTWPALPAVDEAKAALAAVAEIQSGTRSRSSVIAENGGWGEQSDREVIREAARMARLIKQESDPSLVNVPLSEIPVTADEIRAYLPNPTAGAQATAALAAISRPSDQPTP